MLVALAVVASSAVWARPAAAQELPEPVPVPALPPIADPNAASTRLVPVPVGCAVLPLEQAVFIGTMVLQTRPPHGSRSNRSDRDR